MCKKLMSLLAILALLMVAASVMAADKHFDVSVSFKDAKAPDQLEFTVVVKDPVSKKIVFAPKVVTTWGGPAKVGTVDKEGRGFSFSVAFDPGGKTGTYELVVTKNGSEIQKDRGVFSKK